jgi:sterol desaturase/sphingolipid hydroxylase (fatty acid hydroxylase superfamily)
MPRMSLLPLLLASLALSGATLAAAQLFFRSRFARGYRIHEGTAPPVRGWKLLRPSILNSLVSTGTVFAAAFGLRGVLFYETGGRPWRMALDVALIMLLYDFLYYLMHRFPFHEWKVLKRVHAVHHTRQSPVALDALYIHPVETFCGVALLMFCTWVVGPVHVHAFVAAFLLYSLLNIVIHTGLDVPVIGLRFAGYMARKHDRHHKSMRAGNYASITPIPDWLFGTLQ